MITTLVLAMADFIKIFMVEYDASRSGIGTVLMLERKPTAFISKTLFDKNLDLSTYENELLAVVFAITKHRLYLVRHISR